MSMVINTNTASLIAQQAQAKTGVAMDTAMERLSTGKKINSETIMNRDLTILDYYKQKSIPICTVIGGGYSEDRNELAKRHSIIFNAAHRVYCAS